MRQHCRQPLEPPLLKRPRRKADLHRLYINRIYIGDLDFTAVNADAVIAHRYTALDLDNTVDDELILVLCIRLAEEQALDAAFQILYGHQRPRLAGFRHAAVNTGYQPCDGYLGTLRHIRSTVQQLRDGHVAQAGQYCGKAAQGMVGYIQPKHLTLKIEFGLFIPFVNRRNADIGIAQGRRSC